MSCGACSWWPGSPIRVGEVAAAPGGQPAGVRPAPIPVHESLGTAPEGATEVDWFQLLSGVAIGVLGTMIARRAL